MPLQTTVIKILVFSALLLTSCNPVPLTPEPTPTPTHIDREPLQMSLYDFASYMAKVDRNSVESEQYADAVMQIVDCLREDVESYALSNDAEPGEVAAAYWFLVADSMINAISQEREYTGEDTELLMLLWLRVAHDYCLERTNRFSRP